jgi:hypothetical protein
VLAYICANNWGMRLLPLIHRKSALQSSQCPRQPPIFLEPHPPFARHEPPQ